MPENYITVNTEKGSIHIAEDVIAAIVGNAISEVEGVAGLTKVTGTDPGERRSFRSATRGVVITPEENSVRVDAAIYARYGEPISVIGDRAQKAAAGAIESMTGLPSVVNIHVAGVTFDK